MNTAISLFLQFLFSALLWSCPLLGQHQTNSFNAALAEEAINRLKEGVLILRLSSNSEKLRMLSELAQDENLKPRQKKRIEKITAATIAETNKLNRSLIAAFQKYFSFTKVLLMNDTEVQELKKGRRSGFFLDENLGLDSSVYLGERPYFIASYGPLTNSPTGSSVEGILVMDSKFQILPAPFPFFTSQVKSLFQLPHSEMYYKKLLTKFELALNKYFEASKSTSHH